MRRSRHPFSLQGILSLLGLLFLPLGAAAQDSALPPGALAPDAAVQDLEGNPTTLRSLRGPGRFTLLEFWAIWCGQCDALQPEIDAVHARFGDRVTVAAVAVGVSQSLRRVRRHVEENDPGYPFLWDARGEAVRAYEVPTTSVVIIVNPEGKVVYSGVGGDQRLVAEVERLLAEG